ncbi:MAG: hypothetical protein MJZ87_09565 [Bacteroidales bacterium]|nr:hypothetical protein [Bacteroidales bacterium]
MKKILTFCVITVAILLSSCKDKTITTDYTIGCIGYYSVDPASDWVGFEEYMQSVADYNMVVHFTNKTLAENDAQALAYFDEQSGKVNYVQACSFIHGVDELSYGIARYNEIGDISILKSVTFTANGVR